MEQKTVHPMVNKIVDEEEEEVTNQAVEQEDIDPGTWLSSEDSEVIGYVTTRAGRLKIAALTEAETDRIRKGSERPINPGKANSGKRVDLKMLRLLTATESINKANKNRPGFTPIMWSQLDKKLSGEITSIVNEISKLSGYSEEEEENLNNFLQLS